MTEPDRAGARRLIGAEQGQRHSLAIGAAAQQHGPARFGTAASSVPIQCQEVKNDGLAGSFEPCAIRVRAPVSGGRALAIEDDRAGTRSLTVISAVAA